MTAAALPWAIGALSAATAALVVVGAWLAWSSWRARRHHDRLVSRLRDVTPNRPTGSSGQILRHGLEEKAAWADAVVDRLPRSGDLGLLLDQADLGWSRSRFLTLSFGAAMTGWSAGFLVTGIALLGVVPAMFGATVPYLYVVWRKRKRVEAFEALFPEAIDLLGRAIRAGHAFSTGLQMVVEELEDPVAIEFRRVFEEQKYGLPLADSLYELAERVDLVDVRIFVTGVLIQREVGGNLAEILDNLSRTIRERFKIQRQVRTHTAQGRLTGYLLSGLPFVAGFLIFLLNPEYMVVLWTETIGRLLIAVALLMQMFGFLVIRRIVTIEV